MIDENTFVTNDLNERWLDYEGAVTLLIWFPPEASGRIPIGIRGEMASAALPNIDATTLVDAGVVNFTEAAGQLAYYNNLHTEPSPLDVDGHRVGGGVWAANATCQKYFARFIVDFVPQSAGALDAAGTEAGEGGGDDAGDATASGDGDAGDAGEAPDTGAE
jgi:hypothetical protein